MGKTKHSTKKSNDGIFDIVKEAAEHYPKNYLYGERNDYGKLTVPIKDTQKLSVNKRFELIYDSIL